MGLDDELANVGVRPPPLGVLLPRFPPDLTIGLDEDDEVVGDDGGVDSDMLDELAATDGAEADRAADPAETLLVGLVLFRFRLPVLSVE